MISADDAGALRGRASGSRTRTSSRSARRMPPTCASPTSAPTGPVVVHARPTRGDVRRRAARGARRAQRDQRGRRGRGAARRSATTLEPRRARGRGLRRHGAPLRAARRRARRERLRRLRAPPDRGRARRSRRRARVVGDGRIIAIQQPHTYSRTQQMYREFAEVLERYADHTVMLDVYGAREDPVPGVTGELVSERVRRPRARALRRRTGRRPPTTRRSVARDGDYVITLGCGNVYQIIPQVLDALARTRRRGERRDAPAVAPLRRPTPAAAADAPDAAADAAAASGVAEPPKHRRARERRVRAAGRRECTAAGSSARSRRDPADEPRRCSGPPSCPASRPAGAEIARSRTSTGPPARRLARRPCAPQGAARRGAPLHRRASAAGALLWLGGAASVVLLVAGDARRRLQPAVRGRADPRRRHAAARHARRRGGAAGPARHAAAARRRERGQGGARHVPARRVVLARGAPAARARRADRRAHADRRRSRPAPGYTLVDAAGVALSTTADARAGTPCSSPSRAAPTRRRSRRSGTVMRSLPDSIRDAGDRGHGLARPTT